MSIKYTTFALLLLLSAASASLIERVKRDADKENCLDNCKKGPLEVSFILDSSSSIWEGNFTLALNFIEDFVEMFQIGQDAVRVSMVTFGNHTYEEDAFGLTAHSDTHTLEKAIANIPYRGGNTNTEHAIRYLMRTQLPAARPGVRHVAIVLTDGKSQETDDTAAAAADLAQAGLEVFAIGIGSKVDHQELYNIASDRSHVFLVSSYHVLKDIERRLVYETCDVKPHPDCELTPIDIAFVIDSSVSVGEEDFAVGMTFVKDFVEGFHINPSTVRVAIDTFSHAVHEQDAFPFTRYTDKKSLLNAIEAVPWRHGNFTVTWEGINYMRTRLMSQARPHSAHVAVVITDGKSSDNTGKTKAAAKAAQAAGITMYAVGVGKIGGHGLNRGELNEIAGDPSRVLLADSYRELHLLQKELTQKTCHGVERALQVKAARFMSKPHVINIVPV